MKIKRTTEVHEKMWGSEEWIENNELYCGKILNFIKGAKFSMHFHMKKDETWYVVSGKLECVLIDTETADRQIIGLEKGDVVRLVPGEPHRLTALEDSVIFEISTQHFENDSYRVEPGDSQNEDKCD